MTDSPVVGSASFELRATKDRLAGDVADAARTVEQGVAAAEKNAVIHYTADTRGLGEVNEALKLNRAQLLELSHVGRSVFDSIVAGASPLRALTLESGRIVQVAAEGTGGFSGLAKAIVSTIGPAGAATAGFLAVGGAVLGAVVAEQAYEAQQRSLTAVLKGSGAASGETVTGLEAITTATVNAGKGTAEFAQQAEVAFLRVGVTRESLGAAVGAVEDIADATGIEAPKALKLLADAAREPATGFKALQEAGIDLTNQQLDTIRLFEQSDGAARAFAVGLGYVKDAAKPAADVLENTLGKVLDSIAARFAALPGQVGKALYELTHRQQAAGRVADLSNDVGFINSNPVTKFLFAGRAAAEQREIARLTPTIQLDDFDARERAQPAADKKRGSELAAEAEKLNPNPQQIALLQAANKRIEATLAEYARTGNDAILGGKTVDFYRQTQHKNNEQITDLGRDKDGERAKREADAAARKAAAAAHKAEEQQKASDDLQFSSAKQARDAQRDELQARLKLTGDIDQRADIEDQIAKLALDDKLAAQQKKVNDAQHQLKLGQITQQAYNAQVAQAAVATRAATNAARDEQTARDRQREIDARQRDFSNASALSSYRQSIDHTYADLARTAEERRAYEVDAFDEERKTERRALSVRITDAEQNDRPTDAAELRRQRDAFDQETVAKREQLRRSTLGIGEGYADSLTTTIANQQQNLEVGAISSAGDELVSLATGAKDARSALTDFAHGLITEVAKAGVQRFVEKPIADAIFPRTDIALPKKPLVTVEDAIGTTGSTTALTGLATSAAAAATALGALTVSVGGQAVSSLITVLPQVTDLNTAPPIISDLVKLAPVLGFASGGRVTGPGTATSDTIPAMLSPGEFVVPAKAAAKHLPLLEAMRGGKLKGFADGGLVGLPSIPAPPSDGGTRFAAASAGKAAPAVVQQFHLHAEGAVMTDDLLRTFEGRAQQLSSAAASTRVASYARAAAVARRNDASGF